MRLTLLGTGSPEAYTRRASSGYLLEVGADTVLFDCGGGVFDNLLRAGKSPSDITHLYFTHLHSDHMMDYARLVHAAWDEGAPPLKVYGPAPISAITQRLFGPDGAYAYDLTARTELPQSQEVWTARGGTLPRPWPAPEVTEIGPDHVAHHGTWQLHTCPVPHAQPLLECFGFAVETAGRKFVYSGDAGLCPELEALAQDADLLLHWCYRLDSDQASAAMTATAPSPQQILDMAEQVGAQQVILTHFRKHMDAAFDLGAVQSPLKWSLGEDLDVYDI